MNKCGCLIVIIFLVFIGYLCYPKPATVEVTDIGWECEVQLQELKTVTESDWSVPSGARVRDSYSDIYTYTYVNNIPIPIYETKYDYDVERWVKGRTIKTSGNNKSPYYGEVELAPASGEYGVGEEREYRRTTTRIITGKVNGEYETLIVDDDSWWQKINIGDTVHGNITFDEHLVKEGATLS